MKQLEMTNIVNDLKISKNNFSIINYSKLQAMTPSGYDLGAKFRMRKVITFEAKILFLLNST